MPDGEPVLAVATWPDVGGKDGRERLEHELRWFVRQRLRTVPAGREGNPAAETFGGGGWTDAFRKAS